jgi:hypothetical protein
MIGVCAVVRISKSTKESTDCKSEATLLILLSGAEVDFVSGVMAAKYPTIIPGLRSPSVMVGGLVDFGRMLDKIRLAAAGKLPADGRRRGEWRRVVDLQDSRH